MKREKGMRSTFSKAESDFLLDEAETIDPDHPSLETQPPVKLNMVFYQTRLSFCAIIRAQGCRSVPCLRLARFSEVG